MRGKEYSELVRRTMSPTVGKTDDEIRELECHWSSLYEGRERDKILLELLLEIRAVLKEEKT